VPIRPLLHLRLVRLFLALSWCRIRTNTSSTILLPRLLPNMTQFLPPLRTVGFPLLNINVDPGGRPPPPVNKRNLFPAAIFPPLFTLADQRLLDRERSGKVSTPSIWEGLSGLFADTTLPWPTDDTPPPASTGHFLSQTQGAGFSRRIRPNDFGDPASPSGVRNIIPPPFTSPRAFYCFLEVESFMEQYCLKLFFPRVKVRSFFFLIYPSLTRLRSSQPRIPKFFAFHRFSEKSIIRASFK